MPLTSTSPLPPRKICHAAPPPLPHLEFDADAAPGHLREAAAAAWQRLTTVRDVYVPTVTRVCAPADGSVIRAGDTVYFVMESFATTRPIADGTRWVATINSRAIPPDHITYVIETKPCGEGDGWWVDFCVTAYAAWTAAEEGSYRFVADRTLGNGFNRADCILTVEARP